MIPGLLVLAPAVLAVLAVLAALLGLARPPLPLPEPIRPVPPLPQKEVMPRGEEVQANAVRLSEEEEVAGARRSRGGRA